MARKHSTLRTPFAKRKLVVKTNFLPSSAPIAESDCRANGTQTVSELSTLLNETLPTTLETLRAHVNYLRALPLPVGERNRLLLKYWAMEYRLEAVRLLLDDAVASGIGLGEDGLDRSCFDLPGFDPADFNWAQGF
jgi:hypothetical protein